MIRGSYCSTLAAGLLTIGIGSFQLGQVQAQPLGPGVSPVPPTPTPAEMAPITPAPVTNQPATPSPISTANTSSPSSSPFSPRLARAPFLLGDSFAPATQIAFGFGPSHHDEPTVKLPPGGGATRAKIAENSSTLPMDRWIFNYNHFHNAISDFDQNTNVDRFTLGFEKTCLDGLCSVDVRLPLVANNDVLTDTFSRNGSELGNLSVTLKGLLTSDSTSALALGMTVDIPTGEDAGVLLERDINPLSVVASNDAVHLAPFVGFLCAPGGQFTHQGFVQVDVPTNPNDIQYLDSGLTTPITEALLEQTLIYVDYSLSNLLYTGGRRGPGYGVNRLYGLAEVHYTGTLDDSDSIQISTGVNDFFISNYVDGLHVVNLTLGLHTQLNNGAQVRFGTVTPLTDSQNRFFDFEVQAQLNIPL